MAALKKNAPTARTVKALSEANPSTKESNMNNSSSVQVSSQPTFNFGAHSVRVIVRDGEPWFVAADVAKALEFRDASTAARLLSEKQKGTHIVCTLGGNQEVTIVSEGGLYRMVLRSRKPSAIAFSDWVTDEVLPTIRKTGIYIGKPFSVNPEDELTQDEQNTLRTLLQASAEKLPKEQRGKFMMQGWAKLKSHFKVSYREIPRGEFSAAVSIVTRHSVEWEVIDAEKHYHFPLETADPHDREIGNAWLSPRVLTDPKNGVPELELIAQLEKDGHNVTGAKVRILAMREAMCQVEEAKSTLRYVYEKLGPLLETCKVGIYQYGKNVQFIGKPNPSDPISRFVYRDQM
jgi:prophage antirepressor-like protein